MIKKQKQCRVDVSRQKRSKFIISYTQRAVCDSPGALQSETALSCRPQDPALMDGGGPAAVVIYCLHPQCLGRPVNSSVFIKEHIW